MNWMNTFYEKYYDKLNPTNTVRKKGKLKTPADRGVINNLWQRSKGFELIFKLLLDKKSNNFNIVETGTLRKADNWWDGQSALLWTRFVESVGGTVKSVDIDPLACQKAKEVVNSKQFTVTTMDSIEWLQKIDKSNIDLFYLDSYDCKWGKDQPSAEHHLNEFKIIEPFLKNCIVAIDDNTKMLQSNARTGKGRLIYDYLKDKNITPIYDNYQIIYKF